MGDATNLLFAALAYATAGFKVFPLKPRGKIPLTEHGLKDATQLSVRIKEYWRRWPDANIGLVCDGLLVLDFDGEGGAESKRQLSEKYGELPATWTIKTGGGTKDEPHDQGCHYVYRVATDLNIRPGAGKYGYPGLDIRANDSYIVAAPSITRLPYETIDDSPVAPAPDWLIEMARSRKQGKSAGPAGQTISDGRRNATLASLAGAMRRQGATQSEIESALLTTNAERCDPPMDEAEVMRIAASIANYNPEAPPATAKPTQNHNNGHKPEAVYLDTVTAETVRFLWEPYIPIGKLTLFEGDPGVGKSWVALAIATAVSLGQGLPPSFEGNPLGYTLIASAEDGIADTIKPRLDSMQAMTANIVALNGLFSLQTEGFEMLEGHVKEIKPILVIVDPLVAYLSGEMDINKANQVRYATARLARLAEQYQMAVVAVRHLTKGSSLKPLYRGLGSIDFTAAARSVLLAGNDPDDEATRGIVHIKSNLSPRGDPIGFQITREYGFQWLATSTLTADQILSASDSGGGALESAKNFLLGALEGGPQIANEVYNEADNMGISKGTLNRAKQDLKIVSYNHAEPGKRGAGRWYMRLPGDEKVND